MYCSYVLCMATAVIISASPLAPLQALLLFWIVFSDIGQNKLHLRTLRQLLLDEGYTVELEA